MTPMVRRGTLVLAITHDGRAPELVRVREHEGDDGMEFESSLVQHE